MAAERGPHPDPVVASVAPAHGETSADAVARHIRRLVFDGELTPGQRLPQDEVAAAVGVSRIPVREAIIALEREGWLRVEPHRGAYVHALDERAFRDQFTLYGRFFAFAARRTLERVAAGELRAPGELAELAAEISRATDAVAMDAANTRYLATLVQLANSPRLRAVLRSSTQIVPGNFFAAVPGAIANQQRGIAAIQAAIEAGDAEAVERAFDAMEDEQATATLAMMNERHLGRSGGDDHA